MGSVRSRMAGLAAVLLVGGSLAATPALAGQGQGVENSKRSSGAGANQADGARLPSQAALQAPVADPAAPAAAANRPAAPAGTPATPAVPAVPSDPGVPATPAVPAVPPAAPPLGLSHDAPDIPPTIGVVGSDGTSASSPAATPEPTTLLLMGTGIVGLYRLRRRR